MDRKRALRLILTVLSAVVAAAVLVQLAQKTSAGASAAAPAGAPFSRIVDIGHALGPDNPAWAGDDRPFEATVNATFEKDGYFTRKFTSLEHFGTHLDAPAHFVKGGWTVDQIPVERL